MFPITIIFYISLGGFFAIKANEHELPDNGRLAVGGCLSANFPREDENKIHIKGVEDYLFVLCDVTPKDPLYFEKELDGIKKKPDQAYDELKKCLNNHYESNDPNTEFKTSEIDRPSEEIKKTNSNKSNNQTDELINRYKQFAIASMNEKAKEFHEITQIAIGLCGEHEWVRYKDLDNMNQPKAYNCLRDCAVRLFNVFERLIQEIQTGLKNSLQQQTQNGKSPENQKQTLNQKNDSRNLGQIDNKVQIKDTENQKGNDVKVENEKEAGTNENPTESRDDQSEKEDQNTMQQWFDQIKNLLHIDTTHYEYKKGIQNYVQTCESAEKHDIDTLTDIGKLWARHYINDVEAEYDKFHFSRTKEDVLDAFNSYLRCSRWICAMGNRKDIPFIDFVIDTRTQMNLAKPT